MVKEHMPGRQGVDHPMQRSHSSARKKLSGNGGFTIVELLVVTAIVSAIMGLLLPALQGAREAARRVQCSNNLRQVGIALHQYHELLGGLPPGWLSERTRYSAFGWSARLLPYLEQSGLHSQLDFDCPLRNKGNNSALTHNVEIFCCPSDVMPRTFELMREPSLHGTARLPGRLVTLPSANYIGVFGDTDPDAAKAVGNGAFIGERSVRFCEFERGLSNSFLVGERTARKLPATWIGFVHCGEDAQGRVVGGALIRPNYEDGDECDFDSRHPGISNFLWGDGRVEAVSSNIESGIYRMLSARSASTQ